MNKHVKYYFFITFIKRVSKKQIIDLLPTLIINSVKLIHIFFNIVKIRILVKIELLYFERIEKFEKKNSFNFCDRIIFL